MYNGWIETPACPLIHKVMHSYSMKLIIAFVYDITNFN
jgi:hypothetical protein